MATKILTQHKNRLPGLAFVKEIKYRVPAPQEQRTSETPTEGALDVEDEDGEELDIWVQTTKCEKNREKNTQKKGHIVVAFYTGG